MATNKGGKGIKTSAKQVEDLVEQGFSASDIAEQLKDLGYKKSRISQLLRPLKQQDMAAQAAEAARAASI